MYYSSTVPLLLPLCHQNEPTVSPCSAGIGRQAHALISIACIALEQAAQENVVEIPSKMKRQCIKVVKNSVREPTVYLSIMVQRLAEYA